MLVKLPANVATSNWYLVPDVKPPNVQLVLFVKDVHFWPQKLELRLTVYVAVDAFEGAVQLNVIWFLFLDSTMGLVGGNGTEQRKERKKNYTAVYQIILQLDFSLCLV